MPVTRLLILLSSVVFVVALTVGCGDGVSYLAGVWEEVLVMVSRLPSHVMCHGVPEAGLPGMCELALL